VKVLALLLAAVVFLPAPGSAQASFETSVAGAGILPIGGFADHVRTGCPGIVLGAGLRPGSGRVSVGAELGFFIYGHDRRRDPLTASQPDLEVPRTVWNTIMAAHLTARLALGSGSVMPYLEALAGFSSLRTDSNVERAALAEGYPGIRSILQTDSAVSGGLGVGVTLLLRAARAAEPDRRTGEPGGERRRLLCDFGLRLIGGGRADYLTEESIREENEETVCDLIRSPTTRLTFLLRLRWVL